MSTSTSTESVKGEGCGCLFDLKGSVLAKSRCSSSSTDDFAGVLIRVVLQANFPSESVVCKVVAVTKNFDGMYVRTFVFFMFSWFVCTTNADFYCCSCARIFGLTIVMFLFMQCEPRKKKKKSSDWFLSTIFFVFYLEYVLVHGMNAMRTQKEREHLIDSYLKFLPLFSCGGNFDYQFFLFKVSVIRCFFDCS